jgi:CBS domain-containing protein
VASNSITARVAEFLAQFPPLDLFEPAELARASQTVQIQFREAGETLFSEGQSPGEFFYVVRQGSVKIVNAGESETLIDICDEGDIFGVRPLLANEPYLASAQTQEECLIYTIPVSEGKAVIQQNARVALYFAMGYASGKPMQRFQRKGGRLPRTSRATESLPVLSETISVQGHRKVLTCSPHTPIAEAAQQMTKRQVGSIIIAMEGKPHGIVTDKDLRKQVATGKMGIDQPMSRIMSSPVKCVKPGLSVAECKIEMVSTKVHHLCITADGTLETELLGVDSDHDLKLRSMLPLTDAARILVIQREIGGINNTARRFMALAKLEPNNRELMLDAAEGYWLLMELRGRFGIRNQSSGSYIDINSLSKLQRQSLRQVFSTIDELQKVLRVCFQTSLLR